MCLRIGVEIFKPDRYFIKYKNHSEKEEIDNAKKE